MHWVGAKLATLFTMLVCAFFVVLFPGRRTLFFFFFNDTAPTEFSPLSLHAALPICPPGRRRRSAVPALFGRGAEPPAQLSLAGQRARAAAPGAPAADPRWRGGDPPGGDRARARGAGPAG